MTRAACGKPGQQVPALKEKTLHALATKSRIHAIVGQVIDELESRRAKGKSDYVAKLADEVEKGGISSWKALRDLLPAEDAPAGGNTINNFGGVFVAAVQAAYQRQAEATPISAEPASPSPIIDVLAEPVRTADEVPAHAVVTAQEVQHETGDEPVEW